MPGAEHTARDAAGLRKQRCWTVLRLHASRDGSDPRGLLGGYGDPQDWEAGGAATMRCFFRNLALWQVGAATVAASLCREVFWGPCSGFRLR